MFFQGRDANLNKQIARKFEYNLSEKISVAQSIKNVEVVWLGHQLVVTDLDRSKQVVYFVEEEPGLEKNINGILTYDGNGLGMTIGNYLEEIIAMSSGGCECSCYKCDDPNDCGSASCSCTSACGGSCTRTCRTHYNAECEDDCEIE